ncbi:MAG TPA: NADPH:quinone oxidoreductase family protein, partial [Dehalococcoidia bacterium]|nr:NADPH:quinone oxidoreductase family protein [Dehalococcoidia bacterium]
VVVDVERVGVCGTDVEFFTGEMTYLREGHSAYPMRLGHEWAGTVSAVGDGVDRSWLGRRVMGDTMLGDRTCRACRRGSQHVCARRQEVGIRGGRPGALAEQVAVPESVLTPVPDDMDPVDAAALFVTYQTGYLALHRRAQIKSGEVLLVHAGAGGVGSAAIQLGKAAGARVIATAGGPEKVTVCRELGADRAIDYLTEDFVQVVREETDGRGADVIYDPVGGEIFDRSRRCIAWEGRLIVIGFTGGRIAAAPTNHVLLKNYSVVGLYAGEYTKMNPTVWNEGLAALLRLYESGAIRPLVRDRVPFLEVPAGLARLAQRQTVGKVVVEVRSPGG